jgi:hypothetical protein
MPITMATNTLGIVQSPAYTNNITKRTGKELR